ncbi:hypothetical protein DPQ33_13395 [Oceanidesulfovibrio indonesiensis]|uniref:Uncharacterized protein n=1 Tax=Oceanidesulfovibrio indonesiensis TaxID=54767 RepID=A0A7M3MD79_9BACT|nr:hypothetical protein [Oceanidesulfovibrio indonesiensis]TVM15959.1 hypothetical protein DPQ33_13395 [Oceanidesulfovibrio indonesiensis]
MTKGKCPHCEKRLISVEIEPVEVNQNFHRMFNGVSYFCPSCKAILSIGIDPVALCNDTVKRTVQELIKALR